MPLLGDEPADLDELIRLRYERKSIVISVNRGASEWPGVFGDPPLASAAVDRLRHHAPIVESDGRSYLNPRELPRAASRCKSADQLGRTRGGSAWPNRGPRGSGSRSSPCLIMLAEVALAQFHRTRGGRLEAGHDSRSDRQLARPEGAGTARGRRLPQDLARRERWRTSEGPRTLDGAFAPGI